MRSSFAKRLLGSQAKVGEYTNSSESFCNTPCSAIPFMFTWYIYLQLYMNLLRLLFQVSFRSCRMLVAMVGTSLSLTRREGSSRQHSLSATCFSHLYLGTLEIATPENSSLDLASSSGLGSHSLAHLLQ